MSVSLRSSALLLGHAAIVAVVFNRVNDVVDEPYMDEIFHVRQAQTYAHGLWRVWEPKLTTPPGLYLPSAILTYYLGMDVSSLIALRTVNAVAIAILPLIVRDLLLVIRQRPESRINPSRLTLEALSISLLPIVYFFGFLYYTDLVSLELILLSLGQALRGRHIAAAAFGLYSLTFRQTNIIWIAFVAFISLERRLLQYLHPKSMQYRSHIDQKQYLALSAWSQVFRLCQIAYERPSAAARVFITYAPVGLAFLAFLRLNGGIVLGDKSMHGAILHIPQLFYSASLAIVFLSPLLLDAHVIRFTTRCLTGSPLHCIGTLTGIVAIMYAARHYTYEHPFLLADNRHYTFYIWRRFFNVHPLSRYLLAPFYLSSMTAMYCAANQSRLWSKLSMIIWAIATAAVLVPSPLLEFRYTLIPYMLLRLHIRPSARWQVSIELALNVAFNAITLYIFLYKPFRWPTEAGWQRFMW